MQMPKVSFGDFAVSSCAACIFTSDFRFNWALFSSKLLAAWQELLDAEPMNIPVPEGAPVAVPRVILHSSGKDWKCEIFPERLNFTWQRTNLEQESISFATFLETSLKHLHQYVECFHSDVARVCRLAAFVNRYVLLEAPGSAIADRFCREDLRKDGPLDEPGQVELHVHGRFLLDNKFDVNSWARSKAGWITEKDGNEKHSALLFEQDINTLAEETAEKNFDNAALSHFLKVAYCKSDEILKAYYPE